MVLTTMQISERKEKEKKNIYVISLCLKHSSISKGKWKYYWGEKAKIFWRKRREKGRKKAWKQEERKERRCLKRRQKGRGGMDMLSNIKKKGGLEEGWRRRGRRHDRMVMKMIGVTWGKCLYDVCRYCLVWMVNGNVIHCMVCWKMGRRKEKAENMSLYIASATISLYILHPQLSFFWCLEYGCSLWFSINDQVMVCWAFSEGMAKSSGGSSGGVV